MSYVKTTWLEHSMSSAEKLTALDNLEDMYSEIVSYIDAILHGDDYYTETECDAAYFTADNDGSGSGLICATLDGMTAAQIMAASVPSHAIGIWTGSVATIPAGFVLCNGENGTPDLREKFVPCAGGNYGVNDTGGSATFTPTATVDIAEHILTTSEIPKHTHSNIIDTYPTGSANANSNGSSVLLAASKILTATTGSAGGGQGHTHTASYTGVTQSKVIPYYYACYIMKV